MGRNGGGLLIDLERIVLLDGLCFSFDVVLGGIDWGGTVVLVGVLVTGGNGVAPIVGGSAASPLSSTLWSLASLPEPWVDLVLENKPRMLPFDSCLLRASCGCESAVWSLPSDRMVFECLARCSFPPGPWRRCGVVEGFEGRQRRR